MSIYKHILLAIALTPESAEIAPKAKQLALFNQAKLSLIHVVDLEPILNPSSSYEVALDSSDDINTLLFKSAQQDLENFIAQMQLDLHQTWLRQGNLVDEIMKVVLDHQVDLLVIGSHGRHGLELLLGSTANSLLRHARCDVLAVRLNEDD